MKKILLSISISGLFSFSAFSQTTLVLQPDAAAGKDAILHGLASEVNTNYGSNAQFSANAWTFSGVPGVVRSVVEFDISSIAIGAVVSNATLDLYAWDQTGGFGQHSDLSGPNDFLVERVTTAWSESTVTWNTQPSTSSLNQVTALGTSNPTQNYSINVTALVQDMVNDPTNSHGFLIQLVTESYYRRINFCSSDHAVAAYHPKLTVTYSGAGIKENLLEQLNFDVFPNPASDVISITNIKEGKHTLDVLNLLGEKVYSQEISGSEVKISLGNLPKGEYFLNIWNKEGVGTRKFSLL